MAMKSIENLSRWEEYPVTSWAQVSHRTITATPPSTYQQTRPDHTPNSTSYKILRAPNDNIAQGGVLLHAMKNVGEPWDETSPGSNTLSSLSVHLGRELRTITSARGGGSRLVSQRAKLGLLGISQRRLKIGDSLCKPNVCCQTACIGKSQRHVEMAENGVEERYAEGLFWVKRPEPCERHERYVV